MLSTSEQFTIIAQPRQVVPFMSNANAPHPAPPRLISALIPLSLFDLVEIANGHLGLLPIRTEMNDSDQSPDRDQNYDDQWDEKIRAYERIEQSAAWVEQTIRDVESAAAEGRDPVAYYGLNTGFGENAGRAAFRQRADAEALSRKLLLSHTVGVGDPLSYEVVRASFALRITSLAQGYSGIRVEVIDTLIAMLNAGIFPVVPQQGSLGASGDLAPLAHLVLPLSLPLEGEDPTVPGATGFCYVNGGLNGEVKGLIVTGSEAMRAANIPQIRLGAKEGVALINGTAISTAIGALAIYDAQHTLDAAICAAALSAEALRGFRDAMLPYTNRLRSESQTTIAERLAALLDNSTLIRGDKNIDLPPQEGPPQDPYCIRCAPAVLGAALRALDHVEVALTEELGAVTDNPLIFASPDPGDRDYLPRKTKVISGGNFHGEPIALIMDYLAVAASEIANIAERRIFTLTDPKLNRGLPAFLIDDPRGLNSGLMIVQYTAASLVSENKALAHPASVDSIPSSANKEDHVSMSTIAARKAAQIVKNVRRVIAIELLCAYQGVSLRLEQMPDAKLGYGSNKVMALIRDLEVAPGRKFSVIREDTPIAPYIDALDKLIKSGELPNVF